MSELWFEGRMLTTQPTNAIYAFENDQSLILTASDNVTTSDVAFQLSSAIMQDALANTTDASKNTLGLVRWWWDAEVVGRE